STSKTPSYTKSVSWQHHPPRVIILLKIKPHIRGLRVKINAKLPDALRLPVSTSSLQYIEFACFCRPNKAFMPYPA
ncbi:hypothetical protein, partial [Escherichia coli]|uniref:hypothetical protein n=1 Tax=Escherichia coli TaxID=562 RepID=UPI001CDB19D0